jgi:hypothetical protein
MPNTCKTITLAANIDLHKKDGALDFVCGNSILTPQV